VETHAENGRDKKEQVGRKQRSAEHAGLWGRSVSGERRRTIGEGGGNTAGWCGYAAWETERAENMDVKMGKLQILTPIEKLTDHLE
jgi:hypothetical protein